MGIIRANRDFRRLWLGHCVSNLGDQVTMLALPLIAVVTLHANPFQAGLLAAFSSVSWLLLGLLVGAWTDRVRRRPVMIVADLARAGLLGSLAIAATFGTLTLAHLYAVALGVGVCSVFFDVADPACLPALVKPDDLVAANARLQASVSVAYASGPTVAGLLVAWLTAPVAVIADAVSFLWSAAFVASIPTRESRPEHAPRTSMARQIREGFAVVFDRPVLRALALYNTTVVTFWSLERAITMVFLVRVVRLGAGVIGLLSSASGLGAVAGALIATRLSRRLGLARSLIVSALGMNVFTLLMPLAANGWRLAFYVAANGVASCFVVAFNIEAMSYRQRVCPTRLLGRMNATMRFLSWGSLPLGSVLGGWMGAALGVRPTLWIGCAGGLLGVGWLLASPLAGGAVEAGDRRRSEGLSGPEACGSFRPSGGACSSESRPSASAAERSAP